MKHKLLRTGESKFLGVAIIKQSWQLTGIILFISSLSFPQYSAYKIFILNNYIFTYQAKEYVNFPSSISLILRNHIICISDRVDDLMYFGALFLIIENRPKIWHMVIFGYYYGESWIWHYCGGELNLATTLQELALLWRHFLGSIPLSIYTMNLCVLLMAQLRWDILMISFIKNGSSHESCKRWA